MEPTLPRADVRVQQERYGQSLHRGWLMLSPPYTVALCSGTKRRQGQLSVVDFSESPGHWFSDKSPPFGEKYICCQMEMSQGRKEQCALSPSCELCIHPNGLDHQGWASSGELLDLKALELSLSAGLSLGNLIKRVGAGMKRVAEGWL